MAGAIENAVFAIDRHTQGVASYGGFPLDTISFLRYTACMSKATDTSDLAAQLRRAIDASGLSRYEIAKRTGLSYSMIHSFVAGSRGLMLDSGSAICRILALEIRPIPKRRKGR